MDIIGQEVLHKTMGMGTVARVENGRVFVQFKDKEVKFEYPTVFKQFLSLVDSKAAASMAEEIALAKEKKFAEFTAKLSAPKEVDIKKIKKYNRAQKPNIAFKCAYCNGGIKENGIGFYGVCSDDIIYNNIVVEHKPWCSSEDCPCMQFMGGEITRQELEDIVADGGLVCYESQMFHEWKAMAGVYQNGERKGQPMRLSNVSANSLCVLTTRLPDTKEEDRVIFAVFLVDETYDGDDLDEGYVTTKSKYKIKLTTEQARKMPFWRYHANENRSEVAAWSSGLHRYITDVEAVQILRDIVKIKTGTKEEALVKEFYDVFCEITKINGERLSMPTGALCK